MKDGVLILAYCASGPYRHLTDLLRRQPDAWFPWGYRLAHVSDAAQVHRGTNVELWEIDDTRAPSRATPVGVGTIDFVSKTDDYLAFTVHCRRGRAGAREENVIEGVADGRMVFSVDGERSASLAVR